MERGPVARGLLEFFWRFDFFRFEIRVHVLSLTVLLARQKYVLFPKPLTAARLCWDARFLQFLNDGPDHLYGQLFHLTLCF